MSVASFFGSFLLLAGLAYGTPKILEKMPKHQRERIEVLYKGEKAFRDTSGYNLLYSKTAIGSGGFFGKGYKKTANYKMVELAGRKNSGKSGFDERGKCIYR